MYSFSMFGSQINTSQITNLKVKVIKTNERDTHMTRTFVLCQSFPILEMGLVTPNEFHIQTSLIK